jgi:hypothetical protein
MVFIPGPFVVGRSMRHKAPATYETREDVEAWLAARRTELRNGDWTLPTNRCMAVSDLGDLCIRAGPWTTVTDGWCRLTLDESLQSLAGGGR